MPSSAMIGGILEGFSKVGLDRQQQEHDDKMQAKKDRLAVLLNIDPISLDPQGRTTLAGLLDDIYGGTNGKGKGKGGKGQPGPFGQLFEKISPLFSGGKQKRPDGLANPVPGDLKPGGVPSPQGAPPPQGAAQPGRAGPTQLDQVPSPSGRPMSEHLGLPAGGVPQNVPRGTIHPEAAPGGTSLGQLYASQDPSRVTQHTMDQRQAQADRFKADWEAKHGPLTPEQKDELMEWTMGMPAGFGRAGKTDKLIASGIVGPDGKPYDRMERPDGSQYDLPKWEKPPAAGTKGRETAKQMDRDNFIQGYKLTHAGSTDEQATQAYYKEQYQQQHEKTIGMFARNGLVGLEGKRLQDDLANGNWTTRNSQKYLGVVAAEAKTRIANAMKEAKTGYPSTDGKPGPDDGKTQEEIENEIMEEAGWNPDRVRENAYSSVGNEPPASAKKGKTTTPAAPPAAQGGGGFNWDALPKASLPKAP